MNLNATLVAQMGVFFILWWVVAKFIWPPLVKALDERAKKIAVAWPLPIRARLSWSWPTSGSSRH